MLPMAERVGSRLNFWKTKADAVLAQARALAVAEVAKSTPSMTTRPVVALRQPAEQIKSVDLPEPEGPTMATNSPGWTLSETPRNGGYLESAGRINLGQVLGQNDGRRRFGRHVSIVNAIGIKIAYRLPKDGEQVAREPFELVFGSDILRRRNQRHDAVAVLVGGIFLLPLDPTLQLPQPRAHHERDSHDQAHIIGMSEQERRFVLLIKIARSSMQCWPCSGPQIGLPSLHQKQAHLGQLRRNLLHELLPPFNQRFCHSPNRGFVGRIAGQERSMNSNGR
jgi:hypothetical protein